MSKSIPYVDIKCNECGKELRIEIEYENDRDKWTRLGKPDAMVELYEKEEGWRIRSGNDISDYCGTCTKKFEEEG